MAVIQQDINWVEDQYIEGTFLLSFADERFRRETAEKGYGYLHVRYDLKEKQLHVDDTNCSDTISEHRQEIMGEIWRVIKGVSAYLKSEDYRMIRKLEEIARDNMNPNGKAGSK